MIDEVRQGSEMSDINTRRSWGGIQPTPPTILISIPPAIAGSFLSKQRVKQQHFNRNEQGKVSLNWKQVE